MTLEERRGESGALGKKRQGIQAEATKQFLSHGWEDFYILRKSMSNVITLFCFALLFFFLVSNNHSLLSLNSSEA